MHVVDFNSSKIENHLKWPEVLRNSIHKFQSQAVILRKQVFPDKKLKLFLPRKFHGFALSKTIAKANKRKTSPLPFTIEIKIQFVGFTLEYPVGKNIPDAQIDDTSALENFLAYSNIRIKLAGNLALNGLKPGFIRRGQLDIQITRQVELCHHLSCPSVRFEIKTPPFQLSLTVEIIIIEITVQ